MVEIADNLSINDKNYLSQACPLFRVSTVQQLIFPPDINECDSIPCNANAICSDTVGSHTCTCIDGYTGDGFSNCESEKLESTSFIIPLAKLCYHLKTLMSVIPFSVMPTPTAQTLLAPTRACVSMVTQEMVLATVKVRK